MYLLSMIVLYLQTEKEIATMEGDIKELKEAIDAKNAPMMVCRNNYFCHKNTFQSLSECLVPWCMHL